MKVSITADTYALVSSIKVDDISLLKKHNPSALKIVDEKTKNTLFAVDYAEGKNDLVKFGITFGSTSRDANGTAVFTGTLPAGLTADEAKAYIADKLGTVQGYLATLEQTIPAEAQKVAAARKALVDSISVNA